MTPGGGWVTAGLVSYPCEIHWTSEQLELPKSSLGCDELHTSNTSWKTKRPGNIPSVTVAGATPRGKPAGLRSERATRQADARYSTMRYELDGDGS